MGSRDAAGFARVTPEGLAENGLSHLCLLPSKLGSKASRNLWAVHTACGRGRYVVEATFRTSITTLSSKSTGAETSGSFAAIISEKSV